MERHLTLFLMKMKKSRIIVATFASNVDRVQQIINSARKHGRKVIVEGRSMVNIINTAVELGYIQAPDNIIISIEEMKNYSDEQIVLVTTGSQGEAMAALSRIAASIHRKVTIKPGDTVIFSSNPIPGNEKSVSKVINELSMKGAKVIFQDAHVSGHACQEELKLIYSLVRPKFAIPVHGEYRHLLRHGELAQEMGIPKENVVIMKSGNVLELKEDSAKIVGEVQAQGIMVDGLGVGDVGNIVLRDRQHLSENGLLVVVLTMEHGSGQVLAGPDIVSRGFVYVREAENLMDECLEIVNIALERLFDRGITDWGKIKSEIKDSLNDFLWKKDEEKSDDSSDHYGSIIRGKIGNIPLGNAIDSERKEARQYDGKIGTQRNDGIVFDPWNPDLCTESCFVQYRFVCGSQCLPRHLFFCQ